MLPQKGTKSTKDEVKFQPSLILFVRLVPFVANYYIRGLGLGLGVGFGLPPGLGLGVGSPGVGLGIGLGSGLPPGLGLGIGD